MKFYFGSHSSSSAAVVTVALVTLLSISSLKCTTAAAFFSTTTTKTKNKNKSKSKVDPVLLDQAVTIYQRKYPNASKPKKRSFNAGIGMPSRDLDGTQFAVAQSDTMGKSFADRTERELQGTFTELANVYGNQEALQMVQAMPIVLTANSNNFAPSLAVFSETFGYDDAKAMVQRNPGLLFLKPTGAGGADTADNLTMQFSYIVAATRPLGPVLLYGLLLALCTPAIEKISGLPIRETVLGALN